MAKRMQEQEGDNRIVAKSKPTTMNLAFSVSTSSSTVNSPIASKSPGILKAPCRTDWSRTGKLVATEEEQEHLNCPEDSVSTGKLVAPGYPGNSGNSGTEGNDEDWPHNLHHFNKLRAAHGEGVLDSGTKIWSQPDRSEERLRCEHSDMGCIFMSATLQAAVHLGRDYTENLRSTKNQLPEIFETVISSDWKVDHESDRNYWTDQSRWRSSGKISQDSPHWEFSTKSERQ